MVALNSNEPPNVSYYIVRRLTPDATGDTLLNPELTKCHAIAYDIKFDEEPKKKPEKKFFKDIYDKPHRRQY